MLFYHTDLPGCGVPTPDKMPVMMQTVISKVIKTNTLSCPPKLSLLSCGRKNIAGKIFMCNKFRLG
jgi:hypothetical protein